MPCKIKKVGIGDFEEVYNFLCKYFGSQMAKEKRKNVFTHTWGGGEGYCGYKMVDNEKIVGFLGYIFSKRRVRGKEEKFCNLASWAVGEKYRSESAFILLPIFKLIEEGYTITDFSSEIGVRDIFIKLNFQILEKCAVVIPAIPDIIKVLKNMKRVTILLDNPAIIDHLQSDHVTLYKDHIPYDCHHLLIMQNQAYLYTIFTLTKRRFYQVAEFHFISDGGVFLLYLDEIKATILKKLQVLFLKVDSRMFPSKKFPLISFKRKCENKIFYSKILSAEQIDSLYSELILYNL